MSDQEIGSNKGAWKTKLGAALIGALVVLIAGVANYALDFIQFNKTSSRAERAQTSTGLTGTTTAPTGESETVHITITQPDGPVPRCVIIRGNSKVPDGVTVWLAQQPRKDSDFYGLQKAIPEPSNAEQWQAKVELGGESEDEKGKEFVVYAFALHAEATRLFDSLVITGDYFLRSSLPVKDNIAHETFVRNTRDTASC